MTLDVRGSLKNTKLSKNPYVVFEEMLSNAIDSFLIRRHTDPSAPDLSVSFKIDFWSADLLSDEVDMRISCTDNGCGLGDDQVGSFLTKDTSYKDDLSIPGIGKCKGAGRIQYFHHFSNITVNSTYRKSGEVLRRSLQFSDPQVQIEAEDFEVSEGDAAEIGTTIIVANLKAQAVERKFAGVALRDTFSAEALKSAMLVAFLQRLVSLSDWLGDFRISFQTSFDGKGSVERRNSHLEKSDLPEVSVVKLVDVKERDPRTGDDLDSQEKLSLSHYKLDAQSYNLPRNAIAFCAKSSPVKDITNRYLRTKTEQNNPVGGFHHIVLIEGELLDHHVNEQRDDFEGIPEEINGGDLLSTETISYQAIYEAIDEVIAELVSPPDWKREDVVKNIAEQFGVSEAMLADSDTRIRHGDSAKNVVERVLKKYQDRIINETEEIIGLKDEILQVEPDTEEFRQKLNELSWKYTASLKNFDMANLSQLVVRRAAIVQILELACSKKLQMQSHDAPGRRKDERIIHSIFFPMRKDSKKVVDHDIWLLNEEYHYYDYIASDTPLAQIQWSDGTKLFNSDIDDSFKEILERRVDENSRKRPDIALFNEEGSAIIVEFKAPGVSVDDHTGDLSEYAHLLAAKSEGRLRKIYGYLIGDELNRLRMSGWTRFPTGKGFFRTSSIEDPENGQNLGELYSEILFYDDVVDRARKRIGVYQEKLRVDLG
ncbi:MAG: hypothetical protein JJ878_13140 [Alphaproteobacteria bacterium]|nr:hypothetical protein [Alphaproteobacteria bacterium]MBO6863577.1 hypothetical protein [Alphaproteobacteria bacterium]